MILEFGTSNFFSFEEGFRFSFLLNGKCPAQVSNGCNVAGVECVKGANASGKTNVLRVLSFLHFFICSSFKNIEPNARIPIKTFMNNEDSSFFYVRFTTDAQKNEKDVLPVFYYELEIKNGIVKSELLKKNNDKGKILFKRVGKKFEKIDGEFKDVKTISLERDNASVISIASQYKIKSLDSVFHAFTNCYSNVTDAGFIDRSADLSFVTKLYKEDENTFEMVKRHLAKADTGVEDIEIVEMHNADGSVSFYPLFIHRTIQKREVKVPFLYESRGTQRLYLTLWLYYFTLSNGGIMILDEFDINLHPDLLEPLLNLFLKEESNPKHAQLLFATHNNRVMDILGKYRVYLVNKKNNASYIYRLDELPEEILKGDKGISIRNDRGISRLYEERKIGGVPQFV